MEICAREGGGGIEECGWINGDKFKALSFFVSCRIIFLGMITTLEHGSQGEISGGFPLAPQ